MWNNPIRIHRPPEIPIVQKLLYGVAAFVALLIVIGFALPRAHLTEVSVEIDAHPATIFALLNNFRRHVLWSPLAETDPNARILYSANSAGVGATMSGESTDCRLQRFGD